MQMAFFVYDLLLLKCTYFTMWIAMPAYDANFLFMLECHCAMIPKVILK